MLEEKYNFKDIEHRCNALWENNKIYQWNEEKGDTFVIDTPPPTISGDLHIGHIFSYCHTDFIARFQRMLGKNVFYPIGFDDNGLPTERLVEKIYGIRAREVDKDSFIKMCYESINSTMQKFKQLFQFSGISYDWSLKYHTFSKEAVALSQMSFIDLYNKGYVYRKMQPMLWDPVDRTAIAQAEIEDKNFKSLLNTIIFFTEENEQIHIATTRPELLPACVAIFYHPEDIRYSHLLDKKAYVPLTGDKVSILADDRVKMDKGTGVVMCCTFGDELDIYWHQKYNLPTKIILGRDGQLDLKNIKNSGLLDAVDRLEVAIARKKVIEILAKEKLLVESIEIFHTVKCAERSGAPLEILPTYQWFVKVLDQKEQILEKVRECNWHPTSMRKRMEVWINGLNWDWCISRQRYFGVPFPVWYSQRKGEEGKIILPAIKDLPIDPIKSLPAGYSIEELIAEQDVMDTWATSAITPQLNALAINHELNLSNHRYSKLFPADLRSQSHEIIRTWAFYTILKSCYHANSLPWKNIMISGWCLASDKQKMSKSKGNIITPQAILDAYGADVVRYWAASSRLGVDTVFAENIFKLGKRLVTKLWNASKFVSTFIEKGPVDLTIYNESMDKWILSKLTKVIKKSTDELLQFKYCEALHVIEEFFWKDFCDNYLELVKDRAYKKNASAIQSLSYVLYSILQLLGPFLPYITEEIYNQLYTGDSYSRDSIHKQGNWPKQNFYDEHSEEEGDNCVQILNLVRKIKADNNVSVKYPIKRLIIKGEELLSQSVQNDLQAVCNIEIIEWNDNSGFETENKKYVISLFLN